MAHEANSQVGGASRSREDVESLYFELIRLFYDEEDLEKARDVANRLERELCSRPDVAESIRGQEIRSLIAELEGDLTEAIRWREAEIRKILELHSIASGKPTSDYVLRLYDYSDVSDRLDLLAGLYAELGELPRAIATLNESKSYCASHRIDFDGQDLLDRFVEELRLQAQA